MSDELPPAPPAPPMVPPPPAPEPEPSPYREIAAGVFEMDRPPAEPVADRRVTRLAFLGRFTNAEAIAIDLASMPATVQAAGLRRYLNLVNAATYIDLDRQDTRAGVQALEAATMLGAGRAAEILDGPIVDAERVRS